MAKCNPMEILFQRRCSKYIYVTPKGLQELMTDISREVLRCQPEYICEFIANYLDALLITRENAKVAFRSVNSLIESSIIVVQLLNRLNVTLEEAIKSAKIIQRAFRRHLLREHPIYLCSTGDIDSSLLTAKLLRRHRITAEQASEAALVIQRAYRGYRMQIEMRSPCDKIDWRDASRRTLGILRTAGAPDWERNRAATLIKAAYKGYYTRTLLRRMYHQNEGKCDSILTPDYFHNTPASEENESQVVDYDQIMHRIQNKAAILIQRCFR